MPAPAARRRDSSRVERVRYRAQGRGARPSDFGDDRLDVARRPIGFGLNRCDRFDLRGLDIADCRA